MKKTVSVSAVMVLALAAGLACANEGDHEECKLPPPYVGSAAFQKIKSLAGTWETPDPMTPGAMSKVVYDVTSNGSAVVERFSPGAPHEMVSVYHDEQGTLAMTHYCALGNQPHLTLASASPESVTLAFSTHNVINPKKEDHMHSLKVTFLGSQQVKQEWSGYRGGKLEPPTVFMLTRVKETAETR